MPKHIARADTPDGTVTPATPGTFSRCLASKEAGHETMPELITRTAMPAGPWNLFTVSDV
jgi:hypothetical protein